jgi:hypothetical protein
VGEVLKTNLVAVPAAAGLNVALVAPVKPVEVAFRV